MYLSKKIAGQVILLLAGTILLAACGAPTTPSVPTVDTNLIYTSAAQTVQAQFTQNAALTPAATATLEPTASQSIPTIDTTNLPTLALPGQTTPLAPLATLTPIGAKPIVNPPVASKQFQWVSNDPADGTVFNAKTKFDIAWTIKNTGTSTWSTAYTYSYFSGDKYFEKLRYNLKEPVKPGETVTILVDANAPSKSGTYYTWWKLTNDQGQNIGDMDLKIVVVQPGETPQTTPSVTPTK